VPDNASRGVAPSGIGDELLRWYDIHARTLPWRAPPGAPPMDPYRVWLSEIMLQQTQVASARPYFEKFVARWPDFASLAAADEAELMAAWAGLGYYARARNLMACAQAVVAHHGGRLPDSEGALRALPGIGDYTAAAIAAIAFGRRATVVDANVERVVTRLFAVEADLREAKAEIRALADTITPDLRAGDFAQAMMDLGSLVCTARDPKCGRCPISAHCAAYALGSPADYPRKARKRPKPQRYGTIFWAECGGRVLLVRRPAKGLLGGMRALPSSDWTQVPRDSAGAPFAAHWELLDETVAHGFTHFNLELALARSEVPAQEGEWWPIDQLESAGLPTVFAKAAAVFRRVR